MAAGNHGEACDDQHIDQHVRNLIFAVALSSKFRRTRYSAAPVGADASRLTAYAFGGDDAEDADGIGVFVNERDQVGTSFAAPFVAASVYATAERQIAEHRDMDRDMLGEMHSLGPTGWYPDGILRVRRYDEPPWM
jgi:hypothetical protein